MIRWTFFFDEGNVKSEVKDDEEDAKIQAFVYEGGKGLLRLPGEKIDILINLHRVKCIAREIVDEEAERQAAEAAAAQALEESKPEPVMV
jgi:hypothetical protein